MKSRIVLWFVVCLAIVGCSNSGRQSRSSAPEDTLLGGARPEESSLPERPLHPILGGDAVTTARTKLPAGDWKLACLSSRGKISINVTAGQYIGNFAEQLVHPDGTAGQWVVEFCKDEPSAVTEDSGWHGVAYPYRSYLVTSNGADELPEQGDGTVRMDEKLRTIDWEQVSTYRVALQRAMSIARDRGYGFDAVSVMSFNRKRTGLGWSFRFFNTKKDQYVGDLVSASHNGDQINNDQ